MCLVGGGPEGDGRRRGLKVNAAKSKVMMLDGEEGLECEVHVDGM